MPRSARLGGAEPLYFPFERAVDEFLRAGGHVPSTIRSPRDLLRDYRAGFPGLPTYSGDASVEEANQNYVSVRGTTISGQEFEWPEPE